MPAKNQFQKDTEVLMEFGQGARSSDAILKSVDGWLDRYHENKRDGGGEARSIAILGKLYFSLDYWLRLCGMKSNQVNDRRQEEVRMLYIFVVSSLCDVIRVPVNLLPSWLTATFGRSMGEHGAEIDLKNKAAHYYNIEHAAKFKLEFINGLAFQEDWRKNQRTLILANSIDISLDNEAIAAGYSGYVIDLSGNFYTGPHKPDCKGQGQYHSSYLGGMEVLCAGEIKIVNGRVEAINAESGHYKPTIDNLVTAVEFLDLNGIDINNVLVLGFGMEEYAAKKMITGDDFLNRYRRLELNDRPAAVPSALNRERWRESVGDLDRKKNELKAFYLFKSHGMEHIRNIKNAPERARRKLPPNDLCLKCSENKEFFESFIFYVSRSEFQGKDFSEIPLPPVDKYDGVHTWEVYQEDDMPQTRARSVSIRK